jgi:6-phosphogluconolactonase (cycloisomerase 2 family)
VLNELNSTIEALRLDPASGALGRPAQVAQVGGPTCIVFRT